LHIVKQGRSPSGHVDNWAIVAKLRHVMNISLNLWAKRGIRVFDHPSQNVWQHYCSVFLQSTFKSVTTGSPH